MRDKELLQMGFPYGPLLEAARRAADQAAAAGLTNKKTRKLLRRVARNPAAHASHPQFGPLALAVMRQDARPAAATGPGAPFRQWGANLDPVSVEQMEQACRLPISVRGALMPDAHVGYGLPIGGVLATRGAVIPYAVGVDIACRMKLSVLDLPPAALEEAPDRFQTAIANETRFGVGAEFKTRRNHAVLDRDWSVSPVTRKLKDKAWAQLGTSGSGNHFVEFGELELFEGAGLALAPGRYLALLSHSGSRGAGAEVCTHYSRAAKSLHPELSGQIGRLAWLGLDSEPGAEYWAAMQLMGEYAAANHALIHTHIARHLGAAVRLDIENHHNFAWKERHHGEEVVVHRKGATPASEGAVGIIPGSMATPAYVVRGKGSTDALNSAAHGAGRVMSRSQAKKRLKWADARYRLEEAGVTLMSAGLDEAPMVYKDIEEVMSAQEDLVAPLARFRPRLVKMAR